VFTVVNAVGAIADREGRIVRGHLDHATGARRGIVPSVEDLLGANLPVHGPAGNTTLTLVVTNLRLEPRLLRTLGRQVHSSMARAIQPFHAIEDGDVLYAVSTNEIEENLLGSVGLGVVASELAWDAVVAACQTSDRSVSGAHRSAQ
jgi:L-aminopeptidase/D-esterase-like protein